MIVYLIFIAIFVALDQVVKLWTVSTFALFEGGPLIPGLVNLFYIQNDGAAWGMLAGKMWLFYAITVLALGGLFYMLYQERKGSPLAKWAYSLMIAGALGNFIDRLHQGYVVDMFRLEFIDFPIFNVADICLTIGVALLFLYILFFEGKGKKHGK